MKLFVENQDLESLFVQVMTKIKLRMNGTTVGQMEGRGIKYRLNYGVGLPHLKELSADLEKRFDLAERLWLYECRETMLLAAMIVPHEEITFERAIEWSALIQNTDLVERSSMLLWGNLPIAKSLVEYWQQQDNNEILKILANHTLGWYVQKSKQCDEEMVMTIIQTIDDAKSYQYLKSVSFAVRKMIRTMGKCPLELKQWVEQNKNTVNRNLQLVVQEIQSEIQFIEEE